MSRWQRTACVWTMVCSGLASACGPSYVVLRVQADLHIPEEADQLHVLTLDAAQPERVLAEMDFVLSAGQVFPLDVLLKPSDSTPDFLEQRVIACLAGQPQAFNHVQHPWKEHAVSRAEFELKPAPASLPNLCE